MSSIGLHFGHDASAVLLNSQGIEKFVNKERACRIKHALGLSSDDINSVIKNTEQDIPIGLSSTQDVPIIFDDKLDIICEGANHIKIKDFLSKLDNNHPYHRQLMWDQNILSRNSIIIKESDFHYETYSNRNYNISYDTLSTIGFADPVLKIWMRKNVTLVCNKIKRNAVFYQHHLLHAFYAAYAMSPSKPSLIVTGDGGTGPSFAGGGIYFWTPPGDMIPVAPVDGWLGEFYTSVSVLCGFDPVGGPGKMMGLAPYGRPIHFDSLLVGTRRQVTLDGRFSIPELVWRWLDRCNVDVSSISKWDKRGRIPPGHVADVAASAQLILEINLTKILRAVVSIADRCQHNYETILMSGGLALNCPANSIISEMFSVPVIIPPAVNDEGLSIGAAVAAHVDRHNSIPENSNGFADGVYIGNCPSFEDIKSACVQLGWEIIVSQEKMIEKSIDLILNGNVVGICSGKSEVGPRALGHRSILADPSRHDIWENVNAIKGRETWRPFAPAVLLEDADVWFDRGPSFSPYMLFNFRCKSKEFPAVTHFDHTSRVQHVIQETGILFELLNNLKKRGRPPILLNTSFNGPGVPIVETIYDALGEAINLDINYVITDHGLLHRIE